VKTEPTIEEKFRALDNDNDGGCSVVLAARVARAEVERRVKPLVEVVKAALDKLEVTGATLRIYADVIEQMHAALAAEAKESEADRAR
jgi:hypothetical protein